MDDSEELLAMSEVEKIQEIRKLRKANDECHRSLSDYQLFVEGLTRGKSKDESFNTMMQFNGELCYKIAGKLNNHQAASKLLFGATSFPKL